MAETKQKKKTDMIRVTIIGYVKAPEFTLEDFKECESKLNSIEAFAKENMVDVEFKKRKVGRLVEVQADAAPDTPNVEGDAVGDAGGSNEEE